MLRPQDSTTRETRRLDGIWSFVVDTEGNGRAEAWWRRPLLDATPMPAPSSFNDILVDLRVHDYVGDVWYQHQAFIPPGWVGQRVLLRFDPAGGASTAHGGAALDRRPRSARSGEVWERSMPQTRQVLECETHGRRRTEEHGPALAHWTVDEDRGRVPQDPEGAVQAPRGHDDEAVDFAGERLCGRTPSSRCSPVSTRSTWRSWRAERSTDRTTAAKCGLVTSGTITARFPLPRDQTAGPGSARS
jgi:hypothetical protein